MEYVSLLPPEIKARKIAQLKLRKIFLILFVVLLITACVFTFFLVRNILTQRQLSSLIVEREMVERDAAALQEYEDLFQQVNARVSLVSNAMGTFPPWGKLLTDTSNTLLVGTWLSDLTLNYSDTSGILNMRGWAYNQSGVASMLEQLYKLDQLDQVRLRLSSATQFDGSDAVEFQVESQILTGPAFIDDDDDQEGEENGD
ncbi:MAG: hypothetical protein SCJ97_10100 [Bacillota bacterium]|nr:hypothetical protein [Bacillota bacterium]